MVNVLVPAVFLMQHQVNTDHGVFAKAESGEPEKRSDVMPHGQPEEYQRDGESVAAYADLPEAHNNGWD